MACCWFNRKYEQQWKKNIPDRANDTTEVPLFLTTEWFLRQVHTDLIVTTVAKANQDKDAAVNAKNAAEAAKAATETVRDDAMKDGDDARTERDGVYTVKNAALVERDAANNEKDNAESKRENLRRNSSWQGTTPRPRRETPSRKKHDFMIFSTRPRRQIPMFTNSSTRPRRKTGS